MLKADRAGDSSGNKDDEDDEQGDCHQEDCGSDDDEDATSGDDPQGQQHQDSAAAVAAAPGTENDRRFRVSSLLDLEAAAAFSFQQQLGGVRHFPGVSGGDFTGPRNSSEGETCRQPLLRKQNNGTLPHYLFLELKIATGYQNILHVLFSY
jgi:hypothetical protein